MCSIMWVIATGMTCLDIGGIYVDEIKRKEELVKMIEECENEQFLTFLYSMIISFKKKWGI